MRIRRYFDIRWSDLPWLALLLVPDTLVMLGINVLTDPVNIDQKNNATVIEWVTDKWDEYFKDEVSDTVLALPVYLANHDATCPVCSPKTSLDTIRYVSPSPDTAMVIMGDRVWGSVWTADTIDMTAFAYIVPARVKVDSIIFTITSPSSRTLHRTRRRSAVRLSIIRAPDTSTVYRKSEDGSIELFYDSAKIIDSVIVIEGKHLPPLRK